jgi:stearoyl-CoA desaturase (delta-9 desaturase)
MTDIQTPLAASQLEDDIATAPKRKKTVSNAYLARLQRRHFLLFEILPLLGTAAAVAFTLVHPVGVTEVALLVAGWFLTGIGITVGYHRLFTHRAFKTRYPVEATLAVLGSMAGQGPVISWAAIHRRHHELSDEEGDPHSPNLSGEDWRGKLRGLAHSHFLWMRGHEYPNIAHYAPDLIRNRPLVRVARLYYYWVALGLLIPVAVGAIAYQSVEGAVSCLLWGGFVRMFVVENIIWAVNSFLHTFGKRHYGSDEHSRNGGLFSLISLGESWHNNHHAFPSSPSFGLQWYRLDPGFWVIRVLAAMGLAWDLKLPSEERMQTKRIDKATATQS